MQRLPLAFLRHHVLTLEQDPVAGSALRNIATQSERVGRQAKQPTRGEIGSRVRDALSISAHLGDLQQHLVCCADLALVR